MRKAVYAGSFDPITNGHLWMVRQGAALFDELVVAIGVNPDKEYSFDLDERTALLHAACVGIDGVVLDSFENRYLVKYAQSVGAQYVLRGIRSVSDYGFERVMRHINEDLGPSISTVFLMPPREIAEVSSSLVKGLVGPEGWKDVVRKYVPDPVYEKIIERFDK